MPVVETFEVEGHIVDSLLLAKVLDLILDAGADYRLVDVDIGRTATDTSRAVIEVTADDDDAMTRLAEALQVHGANPVEVSDAELVTADPTACSLPASTRPRTSTPRSASAGTGCRWPTRRWTAGSSSPTPTAHRRCGPCRCTGSAPATRWWSGAAGSGSAPPRGRVASARSSSWTPRSRPRSPRRSSPRARRPHPRRPRRRSAVLAVCGPAVVHTGGAPEVARLVRGGWVQRPLRRQRLRHPRHRVERAGHVARRVGHVGRRDRGRAQQPPAGHQRDPPARIDRRRRRRRLRPRRRHARVRAPRRAVRARRVGPRRRSAARHDDRRRGVRRPHARAGRRRRRRPDAGHDAARHRHRQHPPGSVETFCIDINPAVVTKLADRGSHQAHGIVTDVGPFLRQLADELGAPSVD